MKKIKIILAASFLFLGVFAKNAIANESFSEKKSEFGIIKQLIDKNENDIASQATFLKPQLSHKFIYGLNVNDEYQTTDRKDEFKDTQSNAYLMSSLQFHKNFSMNGFLTFSRSDQASESSRRNRLESGGGDRSFENEGLAIEELNITYDDQKYAVIVGKFDLNFGSAWRWDRGIWAHHIAQNYRQQEKLGISGIYRAGDLKKTGSYQFGYSIFTNDRKNLDNAIITERDSDAKSDSAPGSKRSLESYLASVDIQFDFGELEKLSYHFAYINSAVNAKTSTVTPNKIADENGYVLGMHYHVPLSLTLLSDNLILDWMVEYASLKNLDGNADISENYFTSNLITKFYRDWNITLSHSKRRNSYYGQYGFDQNLTEASIGYVFGKNIIFDKLVFQLGYKNQRDNLEARTETKNGFGGLIRLYKIF